MKKSLDNLNSSLNDIRALLDLSLTGSVKEDQRKVIFRSAIVLLIASWEQYIEQLADNSIIVLTNRLRNSNALPEDVKQAVALFNVPEKRNNAHEFSRSVWLLADKGWKKSYKNYCKNLTSSLNTASTKNVKELYLHILGIRDVTSNWHFHILNTEQCVTKLNDLVNLRHDIAHGANTRDNELTEEKIREQTEFVSSIADETFQTIFDRTAELSQTQAIEYSLDQACFLEIVSFASQKGDRVLTLDEIKGLGSSAQGNHNKLCYEPWSLLKVIDRERRGIQDRLIQFYNNEITLPLEILVFDNNEAIAKPDARNVLFSELIKK
jgi:hypothetical protein